VSGITWGEKMLIVKISKSGEQRVSKTGKPYIQQSGVIQLFDRYGEIEECPRMIKFLCDKPYPIGEYELSPASFGVGDFDSLEVRSLVLVPKGTGAKPPTAAK
jgi:hypothetical protein